MYEIIEKNQYGVLVKNTISEVSCVFCKYNKTVKYHECKKYCCGKIGCYYLPDSEAEKLESEKPTINGTTPDVVNLNSDTQKELIDLRVELRVEKEKSKALENYLEYQINSSRSDELNTCSLADIQFYKGKNTAFNHVLEFIKNQK